MQMILNMKRTRGWAFAAVLALLAAFVAPVAQAQYAASLRGTVTDATGAVVPGAVVTLTDLGTSEKHTAVANGAGIYTINALPPNPFSLTATHPGFKAKMIERVTLIPEQANALNITLELGKEAETVTVYGSVAPLLDRDTATLSATISSNEITHLPSFDRDVFQLAQLAPGAFGDGSQQTGGTNNTPGNQGPGGSGSGGIFNTENGPQVNVRGSQYETNGITVDGVSTVSAVWGGTTVITPTEDSVDNIKISTNSYDAEYGRFSGGRLEVTSKSGTNDVHGSAFYKASRPGLNAYQRWNGFVPGAGPTSTAADKNLGKNTDRSSNFGASIGGPLWKNKLFAFFAFEAYPTQGSSIGSGWYETPTFDSSAAAPGSIASKFLSYPGEGVAGTLVNQTCSQAGLVQGVNCNTEAGGLDVGSPITTGLGNQDLTYGGNSGVPGVGGGLDNVADLGLYNTINPTKSSNIQYNGRVDGDITSKDHVSFALFWVPTSNTSYNGPTRSANLWHHSQVNDAFSVIYNHTFSPTLLNQARVNAAGWRWNEVATNPQEPFGLPQDNIDSIGSASPQFFGAPGPSNFNQWTYDYNDTLTKTLGRQNIKVGGDWTRLYYLNNPVYAARPGFNFHNLWDFANDAPYFESGQFDSATGVPFANRQDNRVNIWGFFVQDDYKLRPNLTINAGLRWSYLGSFYSKENNLDVLQFGNTAANVLTDLNIRVGGKLYTPQKSNFGPQLGFAWSPKLADNKLVIRGGFGIYYNQNEIAITANGNGNPPNAVQANFTCPYATFATNPSCTGTGILYETAGNINSLFGYAPNPATITTFGTNNLPLNPGGAFVTGFQSNPKSITNYHYSLDAQYELPYESVATISYLGSQSRHMLTQYNFNVIAAQKGIPLNPQANFVDYYPNNATGNYNGLIFDLKHNFSHQFNLEAQYTWAKTMDEGSGPYEEDLYPYDPKASYGRSDYNVNNAFKLFGLWQPVFFHGANGWLEKVAGEWSLSGIWNIHSGFPFNPVFGTVSNLFYQGSGIGNIRPQKYLGGASLGTGNKAFEGIEGANNVIYNTNFGPNGGAQYFGTTTYTIGPSFPATTPGPLPGIERNSFTTPGYDDIDATLSKGFGLPKNRILGDAAKLEFRADAFNLFNKTNLNTSNIDNYLGTVNPDGSLASTNTHFGVVGSALGARTVQLQARFSF